LNIVIPGIEREMAKILFEEAHSTCAYTKVMRENIDVLFSAN